MSDILKAQKCLMLAKELRKRIRPGDTMHSYWDLIFDLEAFGRGKSEDVFLKSEDIDWHIANAERRIDSGRIQTRSTFLA